MRVANWPVILDEQIEAARLRPFAWGSWDCCQFAGIVVSALTGVDYRSQFPLYGSRADAERLLTEHGGIVGLLSHVLGEPKAAAFAQRGDVIVADFGDGPAAGICIGAYVCAPGANGLVFRPASIASAAWSV